MASYTTNYQLHQWEASDDFLRTDFNTDFQKIDAAIKRVETTLSAAIAGKSAAVGGSYAGNGGVTTVTLGFRPKAVVVSRNYYTATAVPGMASIGISITATGFQVQQVSSNIPFNTAGNTYNYLAI